MARRQVYTLPVVAGGKLQGIIGEIDLIYAQAKESRA